MAQENKFSKLEKVDPELYKAFQTLSYRQTKDPGALDPKTRALVSLALHTALGVGNAAQIGKVARSLGATDDEIKQVNRMVFLTCGVPALLLGLDAF